jgi:parallel beta-helix repeat protein
MKTPKVLVSILSAVFIAALSLIIAKPAAADDIARVVISDDATGGECTTVGKWNATTKTCKLTQDIDDLISDEDGIAIVSNGITLLCNGHSITGDGSGQGVTSYGVSGVTIKDCTVEGFYFGIYLLGGGYNTVNNNTANLNGLEGIFLSNSDSNSLNNNQANDNSAVLLSAVGIFLGNSHNNTVNNNTANNNYSAVTYAAGIHLQDSSNNTVNNNTADNNSASTGDGVGISVPDNSNANVVNSNTADNNSSYGYFLDDDTSADNTFHHDECSDNGAAGSDPSGLCSGQ